MIEFTDVKNLFRDDSSNASTTADASSSGTPKEIRRTNIRTIESINIEKIE
jgi:hypothetical protein